MIVSDKEKIDAMELLHAVTLFTTSLTSVNTVATKVLQRDDEPAGAR